MIQVYRIFDVIYFIYYGRYIHNDLYGYLQGEMIFPWIFQR